MASINFEYNSDTFDAAIAAYTAAVQDYNTLSDDLQKATDSMQGKWNSSAGEAFFSQFNDDFTPALKLHIKFLTYMIECLQHAKTEYDQVVDKAQSLKLQ